MIKIITVSWAGYIASGNQSLADTIKSDISAEFTCSNSRPDEMRDEIDSFFRRHKFEYLNRSAHKITASPLLRTEIYAIKNDTIYISIITNPIKAKSYLADIKSRSDLYREAALEFDLLKFIETDLHCTLANVERHIERNKNHESTFDNIYSYYRNIVRP